MLDLVITCCLLVVSCQASDTDERLVGQLFRNYNKHIRPTRKPGEVVNVAFYLTLLQLISIAEKSEEMTTSQYVTFQWRDQRLKWNPSDFDGVEKLRLPPTLFWKPDIALYNNNDGEYEKTVGVNVILKYTGIVEWLPPAIYKSACSIAVDYFPFDWQNCTMKFRSFTDNSSEVRLVSAYDKIVVDMEAYTDNGEWNLVHCPVRLNTNKFDPHYQDLTLYLIIQRRPLFYVINIIVPCALISSLSVLVFYLPSHCSEKIGMSISLLLGLPVYLLLLAKRVPETSLAIPLIGAYLLFIMLSVTASVICSVLVLYIYHKNPVQHAMSPWVRETFLHVLPPLLYIKTPSKTKHEYMDESICAKNEFQRKVTMNTVSTSDEILLQTNSWSGSKSEDFANMKKSRSNSSGLSYNKSGSSQKLKTSSDSIQGLCALNRPTSFQNSNTNWSRKKSRKSYQENMNTKNRFQNRQKFSNLNCAQKRSKFASRIRENKSRNLSAVAVGENCDYNEAVSAVIFIAEHVRKQHVNKAASQEWHYVAMVLDRFFLYVFLLIIMSGTIYFCLQAWTNSAPPFPFEGADVRYADCFAGKEKHDLKSMFSWNG